MSITILDVARQAGVSKSTVSRVLTGGSVSEKTKKIILDTIQELNYHPNGIAQGLRGSNSNIIGVLGFQKQALLDNYLPIRLAGINDTILKYGYSLLLINSSNSIINDDIKKGFYFLEEKRIDGLIFLGNITDPNQKKEFQKFRPIIFTGEQDNKNSGFYIYMGNYKYSFDAYTHLMVNGHKNILTIMFKSRSYNLKNRRTDAYLDCCSKFSISPNKKHILYFDDSQKNIEIYFEIIYKYFINNNITALFIDDIEYASNLVSFFNSKELELKKDYSIITIEREIKNKPFNSQITSISLSDYKYGQQCGELMIDILTNKNLSYKYISIPYNIIIRNSVKNII